MFLKSKTRPIFLKLGNSYFHLSLLYQSPFCKLPGIAQQFTLGYISKMHHLFQITSPLVMYGTDKYWAIHAFSYCVQGPLNKMTNTEQFRMAIDWCSQNHFRMIRSKIIHYQNILQVWEGENEMKNEWRMLENVFFTSALVNAWLIDTWLIDNGFDGMLESSSTNNTEAWKIKGWRLHFSWILFAACKFTATCNIFSTF